MLVALVVRALHDLARVGLILLDTGIVGQADVVVHIKAEQRAGLSAGLVDNEVVEGVVVGDDQILLDVHHVIDADAPQLLELLAALFQELGDGVSLSALKTSNDNERVKGCEYERPTRGSTALFGARGYVTSTSLRCPDPSQ